MNQIQIISGGQTGVDRAALDAAINSGLPHGGWCPAGRLAEDGVIPDRYQLRETPSADYAQRTEWNVRDSDGTLIITWGKPSGGTLFTLNKARELAKPCMVVDLDKGEGDAAEVSEWIASLGIAVLNVAGPRESFNAGVVYRSALALLEDIFKRIALE